jgi:hypothetical protein
MTIPSGKGEFRLRYEERAGEEHRFAAWAGESYGGRMSRDSMVRWFVDKIREEKPKKVVVEIEGRTHELSAQTVQDIIDGKIVPTDLIVG